MSCYQKQPLNSNIKVPPRIRDEIANRKRKTGFLANPKNSVLKKVENIYESDLDKTIQTHAITRAINVYENSMYIVKEAAPEEYFDLLCTKEGYKTRRILVKGTEEIGYNLILTENEVKSARDKSKITDLFLVHSINVQKSDNQFELKGGVIKHLQNWEPNKDDLTPTQYDYKLP